MFGRLAVYLPALSQMRLRGCVPSGIELGEALDSGVPEYAPKSFVPEAQSRKSGQHGTGECVFSRRRDQATFHRIGRDVEHGISKLSFVHLISTHDVIMRFLLEF